MTRKKMVDAWANAARDTQRRLSGDSEESVVPLRPVYFGGLSGRCDVCGNSSFRSRVENRKYIRRCKTCGKELEL